jgi:hypothetical protein
MKKSEIQIGESVRLAHRADAAVQIVQAQWIDGVLAPGVRPRFFTDFQCGKGNSLCSASTNV